jgi:hypothetical protein
MTVTKYQAFRKGRHFSNVWSVEFIFIRKFYILLCMSLPYKYVRRSQQFHTFNK